jgi:hypothetical protein
LKIDPFHLIRSGWALLTEVPGWPNAPAWTRLRRAIPIALPAAALLVLAAWKVAYSDPGDRLGQAGRQPLLALEREVAALRLACTDRAAQDLKARASETARTLSSSPQGIDAALASLEREAVAQGWDAKFQPVNSRADASAKGAYVGCQSARGKLRPAAGNTRPWDTLLLLLDRVSARKQPIDLTHLAIRADEEGRTSVEVGLRISYLINNEAIAQ